MDGRAGQDLAFSASHVSQQSLRRHNRAQAPDQFNDRAHRRRQHHHLAASYRISGIGMALINRAFVPRLLQYWDAVAADDPASEVPFLQSQP